jgi:hypothetical protein
MKGIVKEDIHIALDGIRVLKYKEGDIIEAKSEFEKAYLQGLIMNEKVEPIKVNQAKTTEAPKTEE